MLDVIDHPLAVVLAKVDVKVGHRHPLRVEEPLKQQVITDRVQIRNAQRVGNERSSTRAPARPHRHAVLLAPVDEVLNDQEVTRKTHLNDGLALQRESSLIHGALLFSLGRIREKLLQPFFQARLGKQDQVIIETDTFGGGEIGQLCLPQVQRQVAAPRNLDRIDKRGGNVRETLHHLCGGQQVLIFGEPLDATGVGQNFAVCNANSSLMRAVLIGMKKLHGMGGHHGQRQLRGKR